MFYGDYHTHTIYSHGKGSVEDNVLAAEKNTAWRDRTKSHSRGVQISLLRFTFFWLEKKK